ncbi:tRNA N(3)-cytidine methyltransferase METTL2A isoform X1 [Caretta caretta]|uniref:tRNA N(3)-cytidine methyltransferase METTL2A isoform X1 n=1 Tax=Caretta caretta TaxID=8467 RepID=UPI003F4B13E1
MAAPSGPEEEAAAVAAPGRRQPFGSRFLTDPSRLFQHNAWDNVEWSEEQEASARNKVQENSRQLVPQDKQDEYELNANEYWNDFYKIHENGFFKDRHWLFTEFPELAPNQNLSQPEASAYKDGCTRKPRNTGRGSCGNGLCSLETRIQEHHQLDLMKDSSNIINRLDTDGEGILKLGDLKLSDGDFPGSSATYRILEVGCGAGNTVFPILQTNNDPGLFVYCCDFSNTAVDLVQTNSEYDSSRCFAFVHDLCKDQSPYPMPEKSLDIIILIFVLSAILPENSKCFYAPPSSPSQRLAQIRRRKKRTRDEMFSELMQSSRTERAQQNAWKQTMAETRKALNERDERREDRDERRADAMLSLMGEQTDMLSHLVELQKRQQEHRPPLQPLYNCLPSSLSSMSSSPRRPTTRGGEARATPPLHPRGLPKQQKAGIQ